MIKLVVTATLAFSCALAGTAHAASPEWAIIDAGGAYDAPDIANAKIVASACVLAQIKGAD
jgi:hypothetical protein